jgi:anti-sigma-K factor RskA
MTKAAMTREELLNLIPAYAVGALDDDERAEVEAWLQDDPEAQMILAEYMAVADHLPALAPFRAAPDRLQADLQQRLAASRGRGGAAGPAAKISALPWKRLNRRMVWGLLVAALLSIVLLGVILAQLRSTSGPDAAQLYAQLAEQAGASHYAVVAGEVKNTVSGDLVVSSNGQQAVLCIWYLPPIGRDKVFQMWLIDQNGARTSGGLFEGNPSQNAVYVRVPLDRPITAYQAVGVSLEPAGGSPYTDKPTGPRVLSVPLS